MHPHRRSITLTLVLTAATAFVSLHSLQLRGDEEQQRVGTTPRAWRLIAEFEHEPGDVIGLAERALDLSDQQKRQMLALRLEYDRERARLLRELGRDYAERVRETLGSEQKGRYEAVLSVLDELAAAADAAREEFLAAVGPEAAELALASGAYVSTANPARFLDVSDDTRKALARIRQETDSALLGVLQERLAPESRSDPAAWQEHSRQYRAAQEKAREELRRRRAETLTPEQLERLEKIEAAAAEYRSKLQDARHQAYETLQTVLGESGG